MSNGTPPQRLFTRPYAQVLAVQLCLGLSYSAFLLLPKFLRLELGASSSEIGWVTGVGLIAAAVAGPFVAGLTRWMSRRTLLFVGVLGSGLASLAFVNVESVGPLLYTLRVVHGVFFVAAVNCTTTFAADIVPRAKMAQAIGYVGLAMLATNAVAPAIVEPLADRVGWALAFASGGVLATLISPLAFGLPRATLARGEPRAIDASVVASPRMLAIYYSSSLMGVGIGVMFTFTQPFALAQGATRLGDFFFGYVAAAVVSRTALATLADRVGPQRVAVAATILYALTVFSAALLRPELLVPLGAALGLAHGLIYPALGASALIDAPPAARDRIMGWFTCAFNTGFAVSLLCLGPVADHFGFPVVFLVSGAIIATGIAPLLVTRPTVHPAI